MATYNWSYRPNISNKYGIVIADSADDVMPSNAVYVALFGNDTTGNGSRIKPFRTITKALSIKSSFVNVFLGSGVYYETFPQINVDNVVNFLGDGDVTFDLSYFIENKVFAGYGPGFYNISIKGNGNTCLGVNQMNGNMIDCILDGAIWANYLVTTICRIRNVVIKNFLGLIFFQGNTILNDNLTFVNCNMIVYLTYIDSTTATSSSIFNRCNIHIRTDIGINGLRNSLFYKCNFRFNTANHNVESELYPSVPDGYNYLDNIQNLREAYINYFLVSYIPFKGCAITDPKFNNPAIGDYTLSFDSPAKNMSYFGTYIGAQSIGYPIKANATGGGFDLSTQSNLMISDNSIVLVNPESEGSIESNVIPNLMGRELATAPVHGFYADRNGQYLDATEDLSTVAVPAGDNLMLNTPYLVENGAITYNGSVIQPGERFITTTLISFTSTFNGNCREILEAPQRHTILARFSDGGTALTSGTALAVNAWYYANGTVNYEGVAYNNQVFKAISTNPFTGSGNVILAMADEAYQLYEPGIKFTSNNAGNTRTGTIIRGNGDPLYERGLEKEFPINAKFIQFRYIIKVNNLKP